MCRRAWRTYIALSTRDRYRSWTLRNFFPETSGCPGNENPCRFWISSRLILSLQRERWTVDSRTKHVLDARGKFFKRSFEIEAVGVGAEFECALENCRARAWAEAAIEERAGPVGDDLGRIEIVFGAEAVARGARSVRRIETEGTRLELRNGDSAVGASELFGKSVLLASDDGDGDEAAGQFERGGDGLFEARGDALLDEQAVDDDFDGVVLALVDDWKFIKLVKLAVDAHADVAVLREFFEFLAKSTLTAADDGREDHDALVRLADFTVQNGLDDLLAGLARDGLAAVRAMRDANSGIDHAEIIVNFRDGANGGARRARRGFLLDGDRGRKAFDDVDFGALHLVEKLARVGGERLDVAALAFGVDGIEGKRRLARAGKAGDDRKGVSGNFDVDVLEVVLACAPDYQFGQAHETKTLPPQEPRHSVGTLSPR